MQIILKIKKNCCNFLVIIVILTAIFYISQNNFLLFHTLAELFSIIIAYIIFIIALNSRHYIDNHYFLFLGISFLFIGSFDLFHTLTYEGMNIIPGYDSNLPTQLWIIARYLESFALLLSPLYIHRKIKFNKYFLIFTLISLLLFWLAFNNKFPACYIQGFGLTGFKVISEYIISSILLFSIVLLIINRKHFDRKILHLLISAIGITIISELSFTLYYDVYGTLNLIGHYLKITAFYLFYFAIVHTGIETPYELIFRELKRKEERLSFLAATDDLTGLYNRRACYGHLKKMIAIAKRNKSTFTVCVIDLDNLKKVNDSFGHSEGDALIIEFADILLNYTRESDYICRIGGDEFLVIFTNCNKDDAENYIFRINNGIDLINNNNKKYQIAFSYGLSEYDNAEAGTIDKLIEIADRNMYKHKMSKKELRT
ncbi:MAG: GGDEF domain-containing protein [Spirochaetes bacterium]|nr:GGDEF domain-containing protein [Spirochaetota bacterium]